VRTLLLCWREGLPDPAGPPDCDLRTLDVTGQTSGHFKVNCYLLNTQGVGRVGVEVQVERERIPDPAGPPDCDLRTLDVTGQTYGHFKVNCCLLNTQGVGRVVVEQEAVNCKC
jgi:hypothetical protein